MMGIEFLNIMMKDLTLMLSPISHIVSYVADDNQDLALLVHLVAVADQASA